MKKSMKIIAAVALGLAAVACASPAKMAEMAENVKVTTDPEVLEVVAGKIEAGVTVTYPKGYFHPKAILEVTPVLVYEGGEAAMAPFKYQGEKVKDNYKVVSKDGQTVSETVHFDYVEGMEKAVLELRGVVKYKKNKSVKLPVKKAAVGCNTTYMLAETEGFVPFKADNYQEVINQTAEGQILYSINSSSVANKELKSQSIKDFQEALKEINSNERKTLKGTEVIAYASPDGGEKLNSKLSDKRASSADKVWGKVTKGAEVSDPEVKSVGQDWEGFQELVAASDIEDKELILRVLSMYSDPAVRENEIKNMSEVFTALKKTVLPELRRARFVANVEFQNYSSAELLKLIEENADILDEEALLRVASLTRNAADKKSIYAKAIKKFNSDRAQFNYAVVLLNEGKTSEAAREFAKVSTKDADLENALGVVALRNGDYDAAAKNFEEAGTEAAQANLGAVAILTGNYKKAAELLAGTGHANEGVALILTGQASKVESAVKCRCPRANYVKAVAAARLGNAEKVNKYLSVAKKDKALAARAINDVEFAGFDVK